MPLTSVPFFDTLKLSCSSNHRGTPFARVLLTGGAGAVPAGGATHAVPGRFRASSRPAPGPVCEVLAALAPGRVLPSAPGNSRKRGPELSEATGLMQVPRWSAGRRARPAKRTNGTQCVGWSVGARPRLIARHWLDAPFGAPPPSFVTGGGSGSRFSCLVVGKARVRPRRENAVACPAPERRTLSSLRGERASRPSLTGYGDEAIQGAVPLPLDCFASLAMTNEESLPTAVGMTPLRSGQREVHGATTAPRATPASETSPRGRPAASPARRRRIRRAAIARHTTAWCRGCPAI